MLFELQQRILHQWNEPNNKKRSMLLFYWSSLGFRLRSLPSSRHTWVLHVRISHHSLKLKCIRYLSWMPQTKHLCMKCHWLLRLGVGALRLGSIYLYWAGVSTMAFCSNIHLLRINYCEVLWFYPMEIWIIVFMRYVYTQYR